MAGNVSLLTASGCQMVAGTPLHTTWVRTPAADWTRPSQRATGWPGEARVVAIGIRRLNEREAKT